MSIIIIIYKHLKYFYASHKLLKMSIGTHYGMIIKYPRPNSRVCRIIIGIKRRQGDHHNCTTCAMSHLWDRVFLIFVDKDNTRFYLRWIIHFVIWYVHSRLTRKLTQSWNFLGLYKTVVFRLIHWDCSLNMKLFHFWP